MDRGPSALSPEARIRALGDPRRGRRRASSTCSSSAAGSSAPAWRSTRSPAACPPASLEQRDLASGTSSRSSKLIHGGLRYLEMLDFGLVREALQERGLLLTRLAPHLVRPVPFLYPLTHRGWERPYVGSGLLLYDAMARLGPADAGLPRHRHLSRKAVARIAPDFAPESIAGAIRYYDCQVDDARLVVTRRPHRRRARRPGRDPGQGHRLPPRGRAGRRRPRPRPGGPAASSRSGPGWSSTPPACGPTRSRRWSAAAARCTSRRRKGIHLVVPRDRIRSEAGLHRRAPRRRCCS